MHMRIEDIKTGEPFESLFPIDAKVLNEIAKNMSVNGYDPLHPVIIGRYGCTRIVLDGHTRIAAAGSVGITEIPVAEKVFADEDEAVEYAIHLQRDRRNLTDADICRFVMEIDKRKEAGRPSAEKLASLDANYSGKSASTTAAVVGTSERKVEKIRTIAEHAAPEVKADVLAGKVTVNAAYKHTQDKRLEERINKEVFEEKEEATSTGKKTKRGSYDGWTKFREAADEISMLIEIMESNRPDTQHIIPARDVCKAISRRLKSIVEDITK